MFSQADRVQRHTERVRWRNANYPPRVSLDGKRLHGIVDYAAKSSFIIFPVRVADSFLCAMFSFLFCHTMLRMLIAEQY